MKVINFCLFLLLGLTACNNSSAEKVAVNPVAQKAIDQKLILEYAKAQGLEGSITPSGMFFAIEKEGEGASAKNLGASAEVVAHYHGTFLDGKLFDSSVKKGKPFEFKLNGVIKGWGEAIRLLNKGGKGTFLIPSHLAYGAKGYPGAIPPNAVLRFEIELLEF
ncbi:MAG: FKBP-type peptidyl-prolyl cis-trans isomerase [Polaribacter sp.]|jgi:FKBP-type peptidyl-prolyl cis-trans isomerase